MAEIPSQIASSAAQSAIQSHEVSKERESRRAGNANAAQQQINAIKEAGETVDAEDADTAVFADAEGTGSQGRSDEQQEKNGADGEGSQDNKGITRDDDGQLHLDIEV